MNIDAKSHSSDGEKETAFAPVTNLTSMFGGKVVKLIILSPYRVTSVLNRFTSHVLHFIQLKCLMQSSFVTLALLFSGLLQSIKVGSDKTLRGEEASNCFSSSVQYSYTDFSSVDHRIKLHIILNVFEHENEELVFLVKVMKMYSI